MTDTPTKLRAWWHERQERRAEERRLWEERLNASSFYPGTHRLRPPKRKPWGEAE